ncbi:hypothetical protein HPB49_006366 [Dermacentor silvarum]|uniref:Uncharacterized protein n=1 Tax=Dermacentor silvarum TaxID=543639 RepID=A0ACB8D384_DERSI|nr:hypothetical protein HPB49_006366 [Dermacentor silvarum]
MANLFKRFLTIFGYKLDRNSGASGKASAPPGFKEVSGESKAPASPGFKKASDETKSRRRSCAEHAQRPKPLLAHLLPLDERVRRPGPGLIPIVAYITSWCRNSHYRLDLAFRQWSSNSAPSALPSAGGKAISTIDALLSDEATPVWVQHQQLELVLAKQAELIEFDRAIQDTLTDADLEADLTTVFEYEEKVSFT